MKTMEPSFVMLDGEVSRGPDVKTLFYDYRPVDGLMIPHL